MMVAIEEICVRQGRREPDENRVRELAESIRELGLLNPLTVDKRHTLIAGLHRLEAVRRLGWPEVECTVSSLEGLRAELAEIDENIVRNDLSAVEYGEILLRRKEIYEALHPGTKNGGDRKSGEIRTTKCRSDPAKPFAQDTADKLGVARRTIERQIQTARNLTPEAKEIIRGADTKISKKEAMKLSRLEPGQQKEAAGLLAAKEIKSVDEYAGRAAEAGKPEAHGKGAEKDMRAMPEGMPGKGTAIEEMPSEGAETERERKNAPEDYRREPAGTEESRQGEPEREAEEEPGQEPIRKAGKKDRKEPPDKIGESIPRQTGQDGKPAEDACSPGLAAAKGGASFKEIVADLKNMDKDCSGTPESFLAEFDAFVEKFLREIAWYDDPYYDPVFPCMTERQFARFQERAGSIHAAVEGLDKKIGRMMEDGK